MAHVRPVNYTEYVHRHHVRTSSVSLQIVPLIEPSVLPQQVDVIYETNTTDW